jgi:uncharacterized protein
VGALENGLLIAQVVHRRVQPRVNQFRYGVCYLSFALRDMPRLRRLIVSVDSPNLFSYRQRDHGSPALSNEIWVRRVLDHYELNEVADGEIVVIAMPRFLGYLFNPVSFWFCCDASGALRAVISEVNNTFREAHYYVSFHGDKRPIIADDVMTSEKIFHVSPFMEIEGEYRYRFIIQDKKIAVWIDYYVDDALMLNTSLIGKRIPLTTFNLLYYTLRYPLMSLRVMVLIHWQAIKLFAKKITYHNKPPLPKEDISR